MRGAGFPIEGRVQSVAAAALVIAAACTGGASAVDSTPTGDLAAVLYLVGDAGAPDPAGEPVLSALRRDLSALPASVERELVYLGDNIYPPGMPPERAESRPEAERIALAQIEVATATSTPAIFVPGNHDWDYPGSGRAAVERQETFVEGAGDEWATWSPDEGCPGPVVHDRDAYRLIVLDTEWFLLDPEDRPSGAGSGCEGAFGHMSDVEVLDQTRFRSTGQGGYMRLEFDRGDRARVVVISVDADGRGTEEHVSEVAPPGR